MIKCLVCKALYFLTLFLLWTGPKLITSSNSFYLLFYLSVEYYSVVSIVIGFSEAWGFFSVF